MDKFLDDENPTVFESNADNEPSSLSMEHWRRFIIGIDIKKEENLEENLTMSKLSSKSRKFSITSVMISQIGAKKWLKKATETIRKNLSAMNETNKSDVPVENSQGDQFSLVDLSVPY